MRKSHVCLDIYLMFIIVIYSCLYNHKHIYGVCAHVFPSPMRLFFLSMTFFSFLSVCVNVYMYVHKRWKVITVWEYNLRGKYFSRRSEKGIQMRFGRKMTGEIMGIDHMIPTGRENEASTKRIFFPSLQEEHNPKRGVSIYISEVMV